jgi:hypothetical protein
VRIWWRWRLVVAAALAATAVVVGGVSPVLAQDVDDVALGEDGAAVDLAEVSAAVTYTVDAPNEQITASARVAVRNIGRPGDAAVSDFSLVLPTSAGLSVSASRNGVPVAVQPGELTDDFVGWTIALGRELGPGRTAELVVDFVLRQVGGNRVPSATRFNPAYVSFPALGIGDAGAGSVRVVVPGWFSTRWVDLSGSIDEPVPYESGLVQIYDVAEVGDGFVAVVEARHDESLERLAVTLGDTDVAVEFASWPGDSSWRVLIADHLENLIPSLESLIGMPWPILGTLEIRESNSGLVHGFGGSFVRTAEGSGIELGPVVDERVIAHELAHAWFDDRLDPWLAEGIASWLAIAALGHEFVENGEDMASGRAIAGDDPTALALEQWRPQDGDPAVDHFGYAASAAIFDRTLTGLAAPGRRTFFGAILSGSSGYGDLLSPPELEDWQRFADAAALVDVDGMSEVELWVLADPPDALVSARAASLVTYELFADQAGDWGIPAAVEIAMSNWDFETADRALAAAQVLLDERDDVAERAERLGVMQPQVAKEAFAADTIASALALRAEAAGIASVEAARAAAEADRSQVASLGLFGADVDQWVRDVEVAYTAADHDLATSRSDRVVARVDDAGRVGARRLAASGSGLAIVALLGLLFAAGRARRRLARR